MTLVVLNVATDFRVKLWPLLRLEKVDSVMSMGHVLHLELPHVLFPGGPHWVWLSSACTRISLKFSGWRKATRRDWEISSFFSDVCRMWWCSLVMWQMNGSVGLYVITNGILSVSLFGCGCRHSSLDVGCSSDVLFYDLLSIATYWELSY